MTYKTGQRFKCKVMGIEATGTIHPMDHPKGTWYLSKDTDHQWYIGTGSKADLRYHSVTDLEILPDTDEPVMGDVVECSDDNKTWKATGEYIGLIRNDLYFVNLKYFTDLLHGWKHIRKAPLSPKQIANQKAIDFCNANGHDTVPAIIEALTDYILKSDL